MSVLDWRRRVLLEWLYDRRPAPSNSLAILTPAHAGEPEMWHGSGPQWKGGIAAIVEDPEQLAPLLEAFASEKAP